MTTKIIDRLNEGSVRSIVEARKMLAISETIRQDVCEAIDPIEQKKVWETFNVLYDQMGW